MKRIVIALAVLLLFNGAGKMTNPMVTRSLLTALQNERAAAARYEAFAARATEEGYLGVAALFHAEAKAEQVHATRFEKFLESRGIRTPVADPPQPAVNSTSDNLRYAINAEKQERDDSYLAAFNDAQAAGDEEAAKLFDTTRDTETEHLNLDNDASRNLSKMKEAKAYYVCPDCGYTTEVKLPFCPSCRGHEMEKFE
jgi:rubrerythrin